MKFAKIHIHEYIITTKNKTKQNETKTGTTTNDRIYHMMFCGYQKRIGVIADKALLIDYQKKCFTTEIICSQRNKSDHLLAFIVQFSHPKNINGQWAYILFSYEISLWNEKKKKKKSTTKSIRLACFGFWLRPNMVCEFCPQKLTEYLMF